MDGMIFGGAGDALLLLLMALNDEGLGGQGMPYYYIITLVWEHCYCMHMQIYICHISATTFVHDGFTIP